MRRALPAVAMTLLGLALIAGFHTTPEPTVASRRAPQSSTQSTTTVTPPSGGSGPPGPSTTTATTTATTRVAKRTITGDEVDNRYGPVQVKITVEGTKLVDVTAVQLPSDRPHSAELSATAGPILRSEALRAKSSQIDLVSGATFTSESYVQSLQSALDRAGIRG